MEDSFSMFLPAFTQTERDDNSALIGRIFCADWKEVLNAVGRQSIDAIITDLPYG